MEQFIEPLDNIYCWELFDTSVFYG